MRRSGGNCHDCGVEVGQLHDPGCDVERCPRCGCQAISCNCVYEVCGMDTDTLEEEHPSIYSNGPTNEMYEAWDAEWANKRMPWTGEWPGVAECREYGLWCVGPPWVRVPTGAEGATEDLNRLMRECTWDAEQQKFVK